MADSVVVRIEIRGPLVIAINPDGSEGVICSYEYLVRVYLGEFEE